MKGFAYFTAIIVAIALAVSTQSCSSDNTANNEYVVEFEHLHPTSQIFINTYWSAAHITYIERKIVESKVHYSARLNNGIRMTFETAGDWYYVDAPAGIAIPDGIAPQVVEKAVTGNYPGLKINGITRTNKGFDVELTNTVQIHISHTGELMGRAI